MLPNNDNKFCDSCQKTVTDFTGLTNGQIIAILSSSNKVCGRFSETQVMVLNNDIAPRASTFLWQKIGLAAAFMAAVPFVNVQAGTKLPVEKICISPKMAIPVLDTALIYKRITGTVTDKMNLPLIGATVMVKGKNSACAVSVNGGFGLNVPASANFVLVITYIGYKRQEIKIDPNQKTMYNFQLEEEPNSLMGEVVVITKPPLWKPPYYRFKRLFHKIF